MAQPLAVMDSLIALLLSNKIYFLVLLPRQTLSLPKHVRSQPCSHVFDKAATVNLKPSLSWSSVRNAEQSSVVQRGQNFCASSDRCGTVEGSARVALFSAGAFCLSAVP